jgi:hypothetical protein
VHFLGLFMDSFEFASPKLGLRCIKNQVDKSLIFLFFLYIYIYIYLCEGDVIFLICGANCEVKS